MPPTSDSPRPAQGGAPTAAPTRVTCPHCGHPLEVVPVPLAQPAPGEAPPAELSAWGVGRAALAELQRRLPALGGPPGAQRQRAGASDAGREENRRWWVVLPTILALIIVAALLIWFGQPPGAAGRATPAPAPPAPIAQAAAAAPAASPSAHEAAIVDTLARYNAAESEAAALLTVEPLRPYLAPGGALLQRRSAQLAERQRRGAPHRSILVRWAIGQIAVAGETATAITQETWSNQEAGAVAPEQATVRVTYTLRWDAAAGRWLIVESEQMGL